MILSTCKMMKNNSIPQGNISALKNIEIHIIMLKRKTKDNKER